LMQGSIPTQIDIRVENSILSLASLGFSISDMIGLLSPKITIIIFYSYTNNQGVC
jgi:hypothetical protein